jgi:hypothetical protein
MYWLVSIHFVSSWFHEARGPRGPAPQTPRLLSETGLDLCGTSLWLSRLSDRRAYSHFTTFAVREQVSLVAAPSAQKEFLTRTSKSLLYPTVHNRIFSPRFVRFPRVDYCIMCSFWFKNKIPGTFAFPARPLLFGVCAFAPNVRLNELVYEKFLMSLAYNSRRLPSG